MPKVLGQIAVWLPSNRYGELGWSIARNTAPTMKGIAILAGWAAVFAALAALRLSPLGGTTMTEQW
jgi:ABC-2 type transport system permease protein